MAKTVTLDEATLRLPTLLEEAAAGQEIVIESDGRPRARLVALAPAVAEPVGEGVRPLGLFKGRIWMSDDLDAPWPEDIRRALEGEPDPDDPLDVDTPAPL